MTEILRYSPADIFVHAMLHERQHHGDLNTLLYQLQIDIPNVEPGSLCPSGGNRSGSRELVRRSRRSRASVLSPDRTANRCRHGFLDQGRNDHITRICLLGGEREYRVAVEECMSRSDRPVYGVVRRFR